jgi:hypothetical protein
MWILFSFGGLSCGFEADGVNEGVDIVDDALVEASSRDRFADRVGDSEVTGLRTPAVSGA